MPVGSPGFGMPVKVLIGSFLRYNQLSFRETSTASGVTVNHMQHGTFVRTQQYWPDVCGNMTNDKNNTFSFFQGAKLFQHKKCGKAGMLQKNRNMCGGKGRKLI